MKYLNYMLSCATMAVATSVFQPVVAQVKLSEKAFPVIVAPHSQIVSYRERTLCYEITANVDFTATTDTPWITVSKEADGTVYVHLKANESPAPRIGHVTFVNAEKKLTETLTITQGRNEVVEEMVKDLQVKAASAQANVEQNGEGVARTLDGNMSTFYHSPWNPTKHVVSEENPIILTYRFNNVEHVDYIQYYGRNDQENGNFGKVEVLAKCGSDTEFKSVTKVDLGAPGGTNFTARIDLGKTGLTNPKEIQLKVTSGKGDFACCAEMEFYVDNRKNLFGSIFADESLSSLKEGVKQADIDKIEDEFTAHLAQQLLNGTYKKDYRVAQYKAKLTPQKLSEQLGAPGKLYDQIEGVTGINMRKGKHAIAVSGLPEGETLPLSLIAWYVGKVGGNFDGGNPVEYTYSLRNGFNEIEYKGDYDALAYVRYYADVNPETRKPVTVHFINGEVNGYLSPEKSNEEIHEMLAKAPNTCIDLSGEHVHSIWTVNGVKENPNEGLYKNCKADDRKSLGYRQFMNVLDSLVVWEHEILGLNKYKHNVQNRTAAYVNFTYYMFQGGRGVSFHVDQEHRIMDCYNLIHSDNDAIWGLSHEWGHLHQMTPYFNWAGMGEVTNNMKSYYNIMRMGFRQSDKINAWPAARKHFIDEDYSDIEIGFKAHRTNSTMRHRAYQARNELSFCPEMMKLAEAMKDSVVTHPSKNVAKALSINEVGVGETLCPFIMLYNYFTTHGCPDFAPDWYESLRQNDDENGSQIEKKGEADKYELLASAQNNNKNGKFDELKKRFPESVWVKNGYITGGTDQMWKNSVPYIMNYIRKTSRISGYNLMPYFEKWGFLRQVALNIGDYGNKWYVMTPAMYEEFKKDMDDLKLKTLTPEMIKEISNSPDMFQNAPVFKN